MPLRLSTWKQMHLMEMMPSHRFCLGAGIVFEQMIKTILTNAECFAGDVCCVVNLAVIRI